MADFQLTVRIDTTASLKDMKTDIANLAKDLNANPMEIKVEFDESSLKSMKSQIETLSKSINGSFKQLDTTGMTGVAKSVNAVKTSVDGLKSSATTVKTLTTSSNEYVTALNKVNTALATVTTNTQKWKTEAGTTEYDTYSAQATELENLRTALQSGTLTAEEFNTRYAAIKTTMSDTSAAIKNNIAVTNENTKAAKTNEQVLNQSISTLSQLRDKLNNYSAAQNSSNSSSKEAYNAMKNQANVLDETITKYRNHEATVEELQDAVTKANSTLRDSTSTIKENGDATQSLSTRLSGLATKFASWLTVSQAIMYSVTAIRSMISSSIELDDAMTQLKIVTDETAESYSNFENSITSTAQAIGASATDLVDSVTTYARLGYDLDESSALAEYTAMLQNVGDIDVSDAQDAITSIIKAFDIDADDIESVMDKLVDVGNNFPISVEEIATGMTNASSALSAAGNSFEQSVALLTAANTTMNLCRAA